MKTPVAANDNKKQRTHANDNKKLGTIRSLDPSDPRSLSHPSHKEQWLELARAIGRQMARDERDGRSGQHIEGTNDTEQIKHCGNLR